MTEKEFMQAVIDYARLSGWLCYHTHDARRSEPGFPDLVMVRGEEIIFAEVKREKGVVSKPQHEWLKALSHARGVSAYAWWPHDMDFIVDRLKRKRQGLLDNPNL